MASLLADRGGDSVFVAELLFDTGCNKSLRERDGDFDSA
jgi:hypothetical protein